jgi:hypothetical protein
MEPFQYRKATPKQTEEIHQAFAAFAQLHKHLLTLPESRERSLAITNLEQSSMWTNKAIAFHSETE